MHSNVVINFEAVVLLRLLPLGPDAYQSLRVVNVAQGAAIREGPGPIERKGSNGIRTQRKCGTVGILKGNSGDVRAMDVAAEENDVLDVTIEDGLKQLPPRGGKGGPCVVLPLFGIDGRDIVRDKDTCADDELGHVAALLLLRDQPLAEEIDLTLVSRGGVARRVA